LKELRTNLETKHEKGVGTPFPRVPDPLHRWSQVRWTQYTYVHRRQTLKVTEKHDKNVLQLTASCV